MVKMENCPICGNANLAEKVVDYVTQYRGNDGIVRDLVVRDVPVTFCETCHEEMLGNKALVLVEAAQRQAIGRLSPDELRTWRESLSKSQTELATILGFGKKTFARWETGAYTLTAAADRYIRLIMANPDNFAYVEQLASNAAGLSLIGHADDLALFDFAAMTKEFKTFFPEHDPAIKVSEVFSLEMSQGRVFDA
jgi:putative zinc finger/helix-turn-helix YgiT family protein